MGSDAETIVAGGIGAVLANAVLDSVDEKHKHGFVWDFLDSLVLVALVVICALAAEWLYTEVRARRTAAHADLISAQASVKHATAANEPPAED